MSFNAYFQNERERHLEELKTWLSMPSISALSANKGDVAEAARWLADEMKRIGLEHVEVTPTDGHPIV